MEGDALKQLFALAADGLSLDAGNLRVQERVRLWVSRSMDQQWSRQKQGSFIGPLLGAVAAYLLIFVLQGFRGGFSLGLGLGIGGDCGHDHFSQKTHASPGEKDTVYPVSFPAGFISGHEIFAINKR